MRVNINATYFLREDNGKLNQSRSYSYAKDEPIPLEKMCKFLIADAGNFYGYFNTPDQILEELQRLRDWLDIAIQNWNSQEGHH